MNIIGYDMLHAGIVEKVKVAKVFSVLADEVSSHNIEHLAIYLRYVDANNDICEDFVTFIKLYQVFAKDSNIA